MDVLDLSAILERISAAVARRDQLVVSYVNVHAVNIASRQEWFRQFINSSDVAFCDGFGVRWAGRLLGRQELIRLSPPDWLDALLSACERAGYSMYLLGSTQETIDRVTRVMGRDHPSLRLLGAHHGFFDMRRDSRENETVIEEINALKPDILLVGFGMPLQEQWISENRSRLAVHVFMAVGALFEYASGRLRRGPRWMTDHGLEWLGRLVVEPRRLWKRYVLGNPIFVGRVLAAWLKPRMSAGKGRSLPGGG